MSVSRDLFDALGSRLAERSRELDAYRNAVAGIVLLGPALVHELAGPRWPDEHVDPATLWAAELVAGTLLALHRRGLVELDARTLKECERCSS